VALSDQILGGGLDAVAQHVDQEVDLFAGERQRRRNDVEDK
jgi:hypothetical protein